MKAGPYSEDLKQDIIRLHLEQGRTIQRLSQEYGMSTSTISRWLTVYRNREAREFAQSIGRMKEYENIASKK